MKKIKDPALFEKIRKFLTEDLLCPRFSHASEAGKTARLYHQAGAWSHFALRAFCFVQDFPTRSKQAKLLACTTRQGPGAISHSGPFASPKIFPRVRNRSKPAASAKNPPRLARGGIFPQGASPLGPFSPARQKIFSKTLLTNVEGNGMI